jgi:hypothetical protein
LVLGGVLRRRLRAAKSQQWKCERSGVARRFFQAPSESTSSGSLPRVRSTDS